MRRSLVICVLLVVGVGCGSDEQNAATSAASSAPSAAEKAVTIDLAEQNESGESGTATLTPEGSDQVRVTIDLDGAPADAQPAHVHKGSCDALGDILHPLTNVENGSSDTVLDVNLQDLQAAMLSGGLAINVHESTVNLETYVACGDLSL
jgi:CHRD domain